MATPLGNVVPLTGIKHIDGLLHGSKWDSGNLTYSLWNTESWPVPLFQFDWDQNEITQFEAALDEYEKVANLSFTRVFPQGTVTNNSSDMSIYYQFLVLPVAIGGFPDPEVIDKLLKSVLLDRKFYPTPEGDVLLPPFAPLMPFIQQGGGGFQVLLHEIGHALGLKHPHDDGLRERPLFEELGLPDNNLYTVMSYNRVSKVPEKGHSATLMPFDIAAIQHIYGANMSYHTGNDTYQLLDDGLVKTIWDAGGVDTFSALGSIVPVVIDLREGAFSIHGALKNGVISQPDAAGYLQEADAYSMTAIAYGVTIENAEGGFGADTIHGNDAANALAGHDGSDVIFGNGGADAIVGGTGADYLQGNMGADTVQGGEGNDEMRGGKDSDLLQADAGNDWLNGNMGVDTIYGGAGDDTVRGGQDADALYGEEGNDVLYGDLGNDTMTGGAGTDAFFFAPGSGADVVTDFTTGADLFQIRADVKATVQEALASLTYETDHALLDLGGGNTVTITGLFPQGAFTESDFVIV